MKPRADFACLSKKCRTDDGEAPQYELPVDAKFCPECGSKRIQRLFNAVGVIGTRAVAPEPNWRLTSSSHAARSTALLQPMYDQREANAAPPTMGSYAVPTSQLGADGKAKPMESTEIARVFKDDMRRYKAPTSPSSVMTLMNRQRVPTTPIRDPRD